MRISDWSSDVCSSDLLDDAAGEAFDKTAKMMGLPYTGGPQLARLAEDGTTGKYKFSRPMTTRPGHDFSFSGLKPQALPARRHRDQDDQPTANIPPGFEAEVRRSGTAPRRARRGRDG